MRAKYESLIQSEEYWKKLMESPEEFERLLPELFAKIEQLNERVYEANVHAEDAYLEIERLRGELYQKGII